MTIRPEGFHAGVVVPVSRLARCIRCWDHRRRCHTVRKCCPNTGREPPLPPYCFRQSEPQVGNRCSGPTKEAVTRHHISVWKIYKRLENFSSIPKQCMKMAKVTHISYQVFADFSDIHPIRTQCRNRSCHSIDSELISRA